MAFGFRQDLTHIFLATSLHTVKATNIHTCPAVSMLWDDRTGKLSDHGDGMLVTMSGTATILPAAGAVEARSRFLEANPNMEAFLQDANTAMVGVRVEEYAVVVGYGQAEQWSPVQCDAAL